VTSELVLIELLNAFSRGTRPQRLAALAMVEDAMGSADIRCYRQSDRLLREGLALYRERLDKSWSLTDCVSISIMRRLGITDVLTSDRHFEQAGFTILLKR
jgi:predicted nucleic acid-binding protein